MNASNQGLAVSITQAREQLRLFILKNELERKTTNRLQVISIRATENAIEKIAEQDTLEHSPDPSTDSLITAINNTLDKVEICGELL
jgi:hypothetical protein